jgi:hypothetical protein
VVVQVEVALDRQAALLEAQEVSEAFQTPPVQGQEERNSHPEAQAGP